MNPYASIADWRSRTRVVPCRAVLEAVRSSYDSGPTGRLPGVNRRPPAAVR